jgi:diamine N-acetyltransferase
MCLSHGIVEATPADLGRLLELMQEYYAHDGLAFDAEPAEAAMLELLSSDRHGRAWMVMAENQLLAGYIVLTFGYSLEFHGRDAFVDEFYLRPQFRRRGLGSRALAVVADYCERHGIRSLHLAVERDNQGARAFYPTQGFVSRGQALFTRLISQTPVRRNR